MRKKTDILSQYYQAELSYLRIAGKNFAERHPEIAKRLDISSVESADPQVERMLESFAFLTGKLQYQIDSQFPKFAKDLLDVIYPPIVRPTPSVTMVKFDIDTKRAVNAAGTHIPKGTTLYTQLQNNHENIQFFFATCSDIDLWPLEIANVDVVSRDDVFTKDANFNNADKSIYYLKISLIWFGNEQTKQPNSLRFFMNGDQLFKSNLLASILLCETPVIFSQNCNYHKTQKIHPIGLNEDESLFPYPKSVFRGFRLLHEYFYYPDKFCGFIVDIPDNITLNKDICIYVPISDFLQLPFNEKPLLLHAVPAVNLFHKTTDPFRLTHTQNSYDLIADSRRSSFTEIYSIECLYQIDQTTNEVTKLQPFFARNDNSNSNNRKTYWIAERENSSFSDSAGSNIKISFVDRNFNFNEPANKIFYADVLCTNRSKAESIQGYTKLQADLSLPVKSIYCLHRPTPQKPPLETGEALWGAISMLSLNSVPFVDCSTEKIKNILFIFADSLASPLKNEIFAISKIASKNSSRLYRNDQWNGFIRGTTISIEFDDSIQNRGIPLSLILANFFSAYTGINSYVELITKIENFREKKWPIKFGTHNYL